MANILNGNIQSNGLGYVKANIDGIQFDSIQTSSKLSISARPVAPKVNTDNLWKNSVSSLSGWAGINAVDIDWNGAVLPNADIAGGGSVTINTTGELLNLINEMQKEIYTLAAAVIAIGNNQ